VDEDFNRHERGIVAATVLIILLSLIAGMIS
jgi:hypothetical protein